MKAVLHAYSLEYSIAACDNFIALPSACVDTQNNLTLPYGICFLKASLDP